MRTHLLTGPGGSGVSSMAAALAAGLAGNPATAPQEAGPTVTLACVGDDGSTARLAGTDPSYAVVDLAEPAPWGDLDAVLASTIERFGGDGDVAEEWRRLPGADVLTALVSLGEAVAATDVLVVDLGDLRLAGKFLAAATRVPFALRGMLGLQALGARLIGPTAAHAVPRWLDALEAALEVLRAPDTLLHVVAGEGPVAAAKVRRAVPPLLLSGVSPGLIVGGGALAPAYDWAPFTPAAATSWPVDDRGRLLPDADRLMARIVATLDEVGPTPCVLSRAADHLTWRVPLPGVGASDVQVDHRGEDLVVTVHGVPHLVQPPAVVRRCIPVRASLDGTYLEVESVLREGAWRRRER